MVSAVTSPHPSSTHDCNACISALGRSTTPTATIATLDSGDAAACSPSGQARRSLLCPTPSAATTSGAGSVGSAVVDSAKQSSKAGVASALLPSGAGGFPVAGANSGGVDATLSHSTGETFGGVGSATKRHCSHCKVADEVLYLCPCGLARYCGTACQRAQWPFHKAICGHAVRAIRPPMRRCDWCRTSSQTLRQCGCGYAYYCDTLCQRTDWPHHCAVCSMVASQALTTTLAGPRALRARREVATQTAHWQICAPVIHPTRRRNCSTVADNAAGARFRRHRSRRGQHLQPGSDGEDSAFSASSSRSSLEAAVDATVTPKMSSRYRSCSRALSENEPPVGMSSVSGNSTTFGQNRAVTVRASSGAAPRSRTATSTDTATAGGETNAAHHDVGFAWMDSCSTRRRYCATHSLYNSLYISKTATLQHAHNPLADASRFRGSPPLRRNQVEGPSNGVTGTFFPLHHYWPSPSTEHCTYLSHAGESELSGRNLSTVGGAALRDQPGVVACLVASRHILEREEMQARMMLFGKFRLDCGELDMRELKKREEEERMLILKEEVLWCVLTGYPSWRRLKQEPQRLHKALK
ncbi:hypothetical protein GH5_02459 [Leishmania sp. Ghana 2012 LV757]|uniref:hypothetical protein n=1 Tax=Leishmania sp. Ghana 2012 LV757 TaxID=2803181 RepID=UPI001B4C5F13|nr:hypothetical protein GH5_02459 [Leishmania sp. Ghana 2012 LV757]